ncbi:MAG: cobalt ECF transporter T component CbiQ [Acidobacteria bacterium]|nr:cobalt ECF transporter T component CbiQ [Acidobacteriota bacterium]
MKHDFLDIHSDIDSPLRRLDARIKFLALFGAIFIIVSENRGVLGGFLFYLVFTLILLSLSHIPVKFYIKRCLIATPFIIMAAAFLPLSYLIGPEAKELSAASVIATNGIGETAISVIFKAYLAVLLLTLLTSVSRFHELLWALRKLKFPKIIGIVSSLMYRHIFILTDELHKTKRARESRTPGKLVTGKWKTYGNQAAVIFLRSWERAERVSAAMQSRGFTGDFPEGAGEKIHFFDVIFIFSVIILFLVVRLRDFFV